MVTTEETQVEVAEAPEVVIGATPEAAVPEPDRWAEFDGIIPGTPIEETPVAEEVVAPEVPAEAPVETPTEPLLPHIDPRIQQELDTLRQQTAQANAQLAQREAQAREQEDFASFQASTAKLQKELEEQDGLTPERALAISQRQLGAAWRAYQAERQAAARDAEREARIQVAIRMAEQHKVPVMELLRHTTLPAMQAAAQQLTTQSAQDARIRELEAQVNKLTKGTVTPQQFAQGVTEGSGTAVTPDTIDALYLKDPVRYGPAYRKFLAQG